MMSIWIAQASAAAAAPDQGWLLDPELVDPAYGQTVARGDIQTAFPAPPPPPDVPDWLKSLFEAIGRFFEWSAPALKPMLAGATWVGGRRWDLRFQSGETLALPEGEGPAGKALTRFARMDGVERLLGRGFVRFDMRDPTRFVVRVAKPHKAIDEVESAAPEGEAAPGQEAQPQTVEPAGQRRPLGEIQQVSDTGTTI